MKIYEPKAIKPRSCRTSIRKHLHFFFFRPITAARFAIFLSKRNHDENTNKQNLMGNEVGVNGWA